MNRRQAMGMCLGIPFLKPPTQQDNIIYGRIYLDKRFPFSEAALDDELASLKRDIIRLVKKNGQ